MILFDFICVFLVHFLGYILLLHLLNDLSSFAFDFFFLIFFSSSIDSSLVIAFEPASIIFLFNFAVDFIFIICNSKMSNELGEIGVPSLAEFAIDVEC